MAIGFERKHHGVSQAVPQSVVRESLWRFAQRHLPGSLPGGGLT
jgi:hypothetical protein